MKQKVNDKNWIQQVLLVLVFLCLIFDSGFTQNYKKVLDLNGRWKFSIGNDKAWASPDYNDWSWEQVSVPSAWENQGFHGYDGYAWYRTKFQTPNAFSKGSFYLQLGTIDDVDEVFLNGKKIGQTGSFPPRYATAYNSKRLYKIPNGYLQKENTIAVRVYDDIGEGGIIHGDVALLEDLDAVPLELDLQGIWKFKTGRYAHEKVDQLTTWDEIIVPGFWENQGYKDYDGYACYALEFTIEKDLSSDRMVLLLGKIDDLDQVYLNGILVGQSGKFTPSTVHQRSNTYQQLRNYYLPENLIRPGKKNLLLVCVYDNVGGGGIYTGSVGLVSQQEYISYWNKRRHKK